jgi:hypothetical protein
MSTAEQSKKVHLDVGILYNGVVKQFRYHAHEHVLHLLEQARHAFAITVSPHLMGLFDVAGNELADGQTLAQADVHPGQELILRQSVVRGG